MWPDGSVAVEQLWKRFHADRSVSALRRGLLRHGRGWRWALRDVSVRLQPGESLGLVGDNGSGKSTLLKVLNGVMAPYAGRLDVTGRVGALIEVRSGIHPELSGRENVHIVGSLLGLSRRDVARRFDEIVAFAQLESAIDRQAKHYSTGMQMRLGFAVAAFLEPDVLLVDEALAVGDAAFQQRCLDRMRALIADGTTLVLVSHDLAAIEATCRRGLWLRDGQVAASGEVGEVLTAYRRSVERVADGTVRAAGPVTVTAVQAPDAVGTGGALDVGVGLSLAEAGAFRLCVGVSDGGASPVVVVRRELALPAGEHRVGCRLSALPLPRGRYTVWLGIYDPKLRPLVAWQPAREFDVAGPELDPAPPAVLRQAPVHVPVTWTEG